MQAASPLLNFIFKDYVRDKTMNKHFHENARIIRG